MRPKYGKAQGGIVQIVTKSGSTNYHGALGAYVGPGMWYADPQAVLTSSATLRPRPVHLSSPHYDLAAEIGGYIPHFRDKIFFFGAFNPSLDQNINRANPDFHYSGAAAEGRRWSARTLCLQHDDHELGGQTYLPAVSRSNSSCAAFGDPSRHNIRPEHVFHQGPALQSTERLARTASRDPLLI